MWSMKSEKSKGNVVLGCTSNCFLMLDCDKKSESEVVNFSREYTLFHDLGDSLVMKSSDGDGEDSSLCNYFIIFGKPLHWKEIRWHVKEAYRLGMVNEAFTAIREFGTITLRVNAKNNEIPPPKLIDQCYFENGDFTGILAFLRDWVNHRELG